MPTTVTVTGAAGQIGYALLFRIASGQMLGPDEQINLRLLEIPDAVKAAEGTAMELQDCAFPLLASTEIFDDATKAFDGVNVAMLVGARPRSKGMERADLLEANGQIFKPQGEALNAGAADDVKILVVGNPANTNALIAMSNAPDIPGERFTAMTRLDQNRAVAQLADKLGVGVEEVEDLAIWGNHSPTMFPDLFNAKVSGQRAVDQVDMDWYENEYIPRVGKRGAEIIDARGASSAASAASAAIDHVRDWVHGADGLRSMAVRSNGEYDVDEGLISSFPLRVSGGSYEIAEGLEVDDFARGKIDATVGELREERESAGATRPGLGRVPALVALHDLTLRFEGRHNAVEVVRVDAHRLCHLGDLDAGAGAHELQRLLGARAAPTGPAASAPPRGACGSRAAVAHARQRGRRLLEAVVLVHQRAQFLHSRVDLSSLLVKKVSH